MLKLILICNTFSQFAGNLNEVSNMPVDLKEKVSDDGIPTTNMEINYNLSIYTTI